MQDVGCSKNMTYSLVIWSPELVLLRNLLVKIFVYYTPFIGGFILAK